MNNQQLDHSHHTRSPRKRPLCLLAHDVDVPMNVGSLFRIADALGLERIYLTGTSITPPNAKLRKTSRSTEKFVEFHYEHQPLSIVNDLKQQGYLVIALEITTASIDLNSLELPSNSKVCLIIGSESRGVSDELLAAADQTVHIPMRGVNSSMNLANACAIAAYQISRKMP